MNPSDNDLENLIAEIRLVSRHSNTVIATLRAALAPSRNVMNTATLTAAAIASDEAYYRSPSPERQAILRGFEGNDIHRQVQRARGMAQR